MVVSPGEERLAADSLTAARRAAERGRHALALTIIDNRPAGSPAILESPHATLPARAAPRPYFEIARTIFAALFHLEAAPDDWIVKIDPDTRVLSPLFFSDVATVGAAHNADVLACLSPRVSLSAHLRLYLRLRLDARTPGFSRVQGDNRYGRATRWRRQRAWHADFLSRAFHAGRVPRRYPSGGFYALSGRMLARLKAAGWLNAAGANGLEWNDDTLLPLAVRALGGAATDLRTTPVAPHWRWMHGQRYFSDEDALIPDLRALHPLKDNPQDWMLRKKLPCP